MTTRVSILATKSFLGRDNNKCVFIVFILATDHRPPTGFAAGIIILGVYYIYIISSMSWGTCYTSGTNNIYPEFPPLMQDGRNYANWQPGSVISDNLRKDAGISSNYDYRKYLVENADSIIKINQLQACGESTGGGPVRFGTGQAVSNNTPYLFKSTQDLAPLNTFGYEHSDLKNLYLSDVQLQSRMVTPVFTQAQLLQQGYVRAN